MDRDIEAMLSMKKQGYKTEEVNYKTEDLEAELQTKNKTKTLQRTVDK